MTYTSAMLRSERAPLAASAGLSRFHVTGRDKAGNVVFCGTVAAPNEDVAKFYAPREFRASGNSASLKDKSVESLVAGKLIWHGMR